MGEATCHQTGYESCGAEPETLRSYLNNIFRQYEKEYSLVPDPADSLADRFNAIIVGAYEQTGQQVAILIDEYDSPLQHSWKTPYHEACTAVYREVFAILKADDKYEKVCLHHWHHQVTQISLFSVLNNLSNISFDSEYVGCSAVSRRKKSYVISNRKSTSWQQVRDGLSMKP